MAIRYNFNNKVVKLPGAYSTIVSGEQSAPLTLDYGKILVIDTGVEGSTWGGGAGINGAGSKGKDSIYSFDNLADYQSFLKGGMFWKSAQALFKPSIGKLGASTILHAKAATTTKSSMSFVATGGGANGGTFTISPIDEGVVANGQVNETKATSTATITNFGAEGSVFSITVDGQVIGTYTVDADDDAIDDVIAGLSKSISEQGWSDVTAVTSTTITFTALSGAGNYTGTPTLTATGGTAAFDTAVAFSGGIAGTELIKGYGYTITSGVVDTAKFIYTAYVGTFTGLHTDSIPYNEISKAEALPNVVVQSPEFDNIQELIDWANTNTAFGNYFTLETGTVAGTGVVDSDDVPSGYTLATGGTEVYSSARLDEILTAVTEEDFSFIFTDQYGITNASSSLITSIKSFMVGDSKFERYLYVGAGDDEDEFATSITIAQGHNSPYIHAIHGETGLVSNQIASGFRYFPSMYTAALVLGRTAGKEPQVPVTNKTLNIDKLSHNLTKVQKERALDAGLKVIWYNPYISGFVTLQDVNTLQNNTILFTPTGKSFQGSFMRILGQINKELVVNAETTLLSDENGVNVNTLGSGTLKNFTESYLNSRVATATADNLILSFRDVTVTKVDSAFEVTYGVVVNNEISKIFFTGFLLR